MSWIVVALLALVLHGCDHPGRPRSVQQSTAPQAAPAVPMTRLRKPAVTGDFDADGTAETLRLHIVSGRTGLEIDSTIHPIQNEYDSVVNWFNRQEASLYLASEAPGADTLFPGGTFGLYCLLNIGDNNGDGRDEIALAIAYLDYSRLNSCYIYSRCGRKWRLLRQFAIHEGAFDRARGDPDGAFEQIAGYLEKRSGKWMYADYLDDGYTEAAAAGTMKPLRVPPCK